MFKTPEFPHPSMTRCFSAGIVMVLVACQLALAGSNQTESATTNQPPSQKLESWTDQVHDNVNRNFILYASKADQWLSSNDLALEENDVSRMKLSITTQYEDEEYSFHPACKLRLALPMTRRRFQIIIDRFSSETMPEGERDINDRRDNSDRRTAVGFRFVGVSTTNIHRHFDLGVSMPKIIPYARANASWGWTWGDWTPRLTGQVSWERDNGFGAKTPLEIRKEVAPKLWLKTYSEASWVETEPGLFFAQDISLHWLRTDRDALSPFIEFTARSTPFDYDSNAYDHPGTFLERAWFSVRYRRQIYKDWLFVEFEPGVYFSREFDFRPEPVTRFKIEAVFGAVSLKRDDIMEELAPGL